MATTYFYVRARPVQASSAMLTSSFWQKWNTGKLAGKRMVYIFFLYIWSQCLGHQNVVMHFICKCLVVSITYVASVYLSDFSIYIFCSKLNKKSTIKRKCMDIYTIHNHCLWHVLDQLSRSWSAAWPNKGWPFSEASVKQGQYMTVIWM